MVYIHYLISLTGILAVVISQAHGDVVVPKSQAKNPESGTCVWYGECETPYNCQYQGNAQPRRLDAAGEAIFKEICAPMLTRGEFLFSYLSFVKEKISYAPWNKLIFLVIAPNIIILES